MMKTVKNECFIEFEEKKSKFIGYIKPVSTKEEAEEFIRNIKSKHRDATHNCSAYKILNEKEFFKMDDDGEPSGTAGKPIGDTIKNMKVENVVIVVTRYFGGIKLGAGGLIRAYSRAAKEAILFAEIIDYIKTEIITIQFLYEKSSEIDKLIEKYNGTLLDKVFSDRITYKLKINSDFIEEIKKYGNIMII